MELLALRALGPPHWTEENELMFRGQLGVNIDGLDAQSLATILDSLQGHIIAGHPRDESVLEDRRSKAQAALATLMEGKKPGFLRCHLYIKVIFYQDRLGTNIGKTLKKSPFSRRQRPVIQVISGWRG